MLVDVLRRSQRALAECRIDGLATNLQHGVPCPEAARVAALCVAPGDFVNENEVLMHLHAVDDALPSAADALAHDPAHIRPDLQRVFDRDALLQDAARPAQVARRHAAGGRTARENVADLCDAGSFIEYGGVAVAAQSRRRTHDDLVRNTPADGMVTGIGAVNSADHGPERSRCAVMAYDYTVLAGTQGWRNHHKKDRLLGLAHQWGLPTVLFAEGGGGRPGEVDMPIVAGLNNHTFSQFAALSGKVPVVGGFDAPVFTVAWPSAEFGAMELEGAVKLGYSKELAAAAEGPEREALYAQLVAQKYANGSAINMATTLEIDAVIDPANIRAWLLHGLNSAPPAVTGAAAAIPASRFIDTW